MAVTGNEPSCTGDEGTVCFGKFNRVAFRGKRNDSISAARFFYCAKASAEERKGSKHPTVKPIALMRYLVRLVTPPGGTVLDCFAGTGPTGQAAMMEGMQYILVEKEAEHIKDIENRLRDTQIGMTL